MTSRQHRAYIGLGGNLERPVREIEIAIEELDALEQSRLGACSSLYRSVPVEVPEPQPDYVNAVALLLTGLAPHALLEALQAIEARHGPRKAHRNAARILDLDLLLYDSLVLDTPALKLPHPRAHERAFVLGPLLEISPEATIPGRGSARELLARIAGDPRQSLVRIGGSGTAGSGRDSARSA